MGAPITVICASNKNKYANEPLSLENCGERYASAWFRGKEERGKDPGKSDLRPRTPTEDPWEPLKPSKGPGILFYERIRSLQENGSKCVYSGPHPRLHQAALPHPKLLATHLVTQKTVF